MGDFHVAGLLRRIRRTADMSQRELADALGVAPSVVAHAEAGRREMTAGLLARAADLAGLRLALLDADGTEVAAMSAGTARDGAGRRFPAHLDTAYSYVGPYAEPRRDRPQPWYTFERDRRWRDTLRAQRGTPEDHLSPQPGGSPAERAASQREEARRAQRAEWERRRDAGELPPLPAWVCDCPPECAEDDDGTRPFHTDDCVCGCDLG